MFAQYGHESVLRSGDFSLCDSAAPYSYRVDDSAEVLMLRIPENILSEYLPSPENVCGRHSHASNGLTSAVAALALSLCDRLETGLPSEFCARVARHLMELLATAYALEFDSQPAGPSVISGRHAQVKLYIEQHLRDPHLTPSMIASRHKLSTRYLRMVFAVGGETISAYILRRRLEECARQISDPRWRGRSISEIAYAWGFNSTSHFARTFRMRFKSFAAAITAGSWWRILLRFMVGSGYLLWGVVFVGWYDVLCWVDIVGLCFRFVVMSAGWWFVGG